ncbi:MTAP family purine nucleoside phosphorylase [Saccharothrix sp. AJ9571]|nr:MTAP family purine nucleoside phosphorylase [Saccharothrix sp. AJ9571]
MLEDAETAEMTSPYGSPSAPVTFGTIAGRRVAFLPRHGVDHQFPPHAINYRANLWCLGEAGVTDLMTLCSAGSLSPAVAPGHLVVCDQVIDATKRRVDTYCDGIPITHVSLADPYDEEMRATAVARAKAMGLPVHDRGTVVVIEGPRFATRAESRAHKAAGAELINMTQYPEVALARELQIACCGIALITDYDAGLEDRADVMPVTGVSAYQLFEEFAERLRALAIDLVEHLPLSPNRPALTALREARFRS